MKIAKGVRIIYPDSVLTKLQYRCQAFLLEFATHPNYSILANYYEERFYIASCCADNHLFQFL